MKRNTTITFLLTLVLFVVPQSGKSEEFRKVGTSAAQFLKVGVGARALAMGGAFESIADDASTVYWNPAGITNISRTTWTFTHTDWLVDTGHDFSAVIVPLNESSVLGLSINAMTIGEEEITTESEPTGTGQFWNAQGIAAGLSYARQMTDRFSMGGTVKYISERIWNESASAVAVDVGTYLDTKFKGIVIGMSFTNFGNSMQLSGRDLIREHDPNEANSLNANVETRLYAEPWPLPTCFTIGTSIELIGDGQNFIQSETSRLILAVNGSHPNDDSEKLNIGFEYAFRNLGFIRGGYSQGFDLVDYSVGAGLRLNVYGRDLMLDYAYIPYGDFTNVQTFSISSGF